MSSYMMRMEEEEYHPDKYYLFILDRVSYEDKRNYWLIDLGYYDENDYDFLNETLEEIFERNSWIDIKRYYLGVFDERGKDNFIRDKLNNLEPIIHGIEVLLGKGE